MKIIAKNPNSYNDTNVLLDLLINKDLIFSTSPTYTTNKFIAIPYCEYLSFDENSEEKRLYIEITDINTNEKSLQTSRYVTRNFADDQTQYGYEEGYDPFINIEYYSSLVPAVIAPLAKITLIDDDKLLLYNISGSLEFKISLLQHYKRNIYNNICETIPINESELGDKWTKMAEYSSYFHQLGYYNEDKSNYDNNKYIYKLSTGASCEAVYKNGVLVNDSLIMGTYNFADSGYDIYGHYYKDVYPYIIWGNNYYDDSTIIERIVWDKDSHYVVEFEIFGKDGSLRRFRGSDLLYYGILNRFFDDLSMEKLDEIRIRNNEPLITL